MSFLFEKSATWRWIVASSKASKAFYATFAGVCLVVPWMLGHAVMSTTNRSQLELNEELRRRARDDSLAVGRVNKERLQQLLHEIQHKEDTEDRYAAALRGETLTGTPGARIRGGGGTSMQVSSSSSAPPPPIPPATTQRSLNTVVDSKLPAPSTS
ncbi:unnamed protein product [Sphagnum balticum]